MPDVVPFSLADYCNDPSYPAQLEVGLYSNQLDLAAGVRLVDLVECVFPGYRRHVGDIWAQRFSADQGGPFLRSRSLTWTCREVAPASRARGAFLVAKMAGVAQFVALNEFDNVLEFSAPGKTSTIVFALARIRSFTSSRA